MKKMLVLLLALFSIVTLNAQDGARGVSKSKFVSISKDPPKPPFLEVEAGSLRFVDNGGNKIINANEESNVNFTLTNSGVGAGLNLELIVDEMNDLNGLLYSRKMDLGNLEPGKSKHITIPINTNMHLPDSKANFEIQVKELNGFGTDVIFIEVETRAFLPPMVKVVDYKVNSEKGATLQKRRPFEVQILVQNIGQGIAENITINLPVPDNMFCLSDNGHIKIQKLNPGEQRLIEYSMITTNNYASNTIKLDFLLSESYNKYAEDKHVKLTMNQVVSDSRLVVAGIQEDEKTISMGSLRSDVDKNIPLSPSKTRSRIALIIGNEDYSGNLNAEINVDFARNDAEIFKQYTLRTLGVEEINMFFIINATAGEMHREIDKVVSLLKRMGPDAELIFYHAGHGLPDENTNAPYLIPVDVDATNLGAAIKLSEVYTKLGGAGANRITVFLDACFSGGGRNQGLLAARGVKIKPKDDLISGKMVVFSATTGKQSALPYKNQQHGMFTYFLLSKLKESKGKVRYGDLGEFIKNKVSVESLRINGREQDPEVRVSPQANSVWSDWRF